MKFRGTPTYGGESYYKLIGSAYQGSPVQPGDASLAGPNGKRGGLLMTHAGPVVRMKGNDVQREDPPAGAQREPA